MCHIPSSTCTCSPVILNAPPASPAEIEAVSVVSMESSSVQPKSITWNSNTAHEIQTRVCHVECEPFMTCHISNHYYYCFTSQLVTYRVTLLLVVFLYYVFFTLFGTLTGAGTWNGTRTLETIGSAM